MLATGRADGDRLQFFAARGIADLRAAEDWIFRALSAHPSAAVDQRRDMHPRRHKITRRAMRVVVVPENRHLLAGAHAPAVQVGPHRARRHDAGTVIIGKRHRAFQRPGRKDRLLGRDAPETL